MSRIFLFLIIGGICLLAKGAYECFIQAGTKEKPTTVSIAELERSVPFNRHLIVTGGKAVFNEGIVYYETRRNVKVTGSEVYFIPIQDISLAAYPSLTPPLLVRITGYQMDALKKKDFSLDLIHGIRMTHLDLEDKAENLLTERYGEGAVKNMVILEYEKAVTGIRDGFNHMLGGVACIFGAVMLAGLINRSKY
jgi:hypothetical protein